MIKLLIAFALAWSIFSPSYQESVFQGCTYAVIPDSSIIEWKGASPKVSHHGTFAVTSQGIDVVDGQVVGGTFRIPIETIRNIDLPKTIKPVLLKHLKSKDFFHVALYPEATFTLTEIIPLTNTADGAIEGANQMVSGNFTMLGQTHPLSFPAKITLAHNMLSVESMFRLDRTKWGMTHAADPSLGNRYILPEVDIHLKVLARINHEE
jgi:polyisoprenoid-binding protein YceI